MKRVSSSTPLVSLSAVSLDLETTGLDVKEARIVQIGALRLRQDKLVPGSELEKIIDPQVTIPAASTKIHGISNADTRMAPDIAAAWHELTAYLGTSVMIGHTIAYDLTVLENEAARHNLPWQRPRSLCVRLLAQHAVPELADPTLDKLASWFAIDIERRHTALSDAQTAALIFLKLVPLLAAKGIKTLAEAERAILGNAISIREGTNAGWVAPVVNPSDLALSAGIKAFDTFAYRHTIADIMSGTPVIAKRDISLQAAIGIMAEKSISSLLINDSGNPGELVSEYAIITERDVLRQIAKSGPAALKQKAGNFASSPILSIRQKAFVYRALSRMRRLKIRHLAVVDDKRHLTGVLSARDLLKARSDPAIALDDEINNAANAADLAAAWATLPEVVYSLVEERLDAHTITRIVSEEIRSMTERAAILAEMDMAQGGWGKPPCNYAVMVLGSGGRGESLLKPDQDNAIIFETGEPGGKEDQWFAELGARFAAILDAAGIPYCDGGIMAKNANWRGSLKTWQERVTGWIDKPSPEALLNVDILFDQIAVHGHRTLSAELFEYCYENGSQSTAFCKTLSLGLNSLSSPFGFLGKIKSQNNRLDLKLHGLFPIVTCARALAIRHNMAEHSTRERLHALSQLDKGDIGLVKRLIGHHSLFLSLMLGEQESEIRSGRKPSNFIDLSKQDRAVMEELKKALSDVQMIPSLLQDMMFQ